MTNLAPDTSPAHARHIRLLITALTSSSPVPSYLLVNPPFHTLTSQALPPLLDVLLPSLTKSESLPLSLKLITLLLQTTPPPVITPHLSTISQKLTHLLKPPHTPRIRAQALAMLAILLTQPHLPPLNRTNLTQSALTHALRTLTDPFPPLVLSALATFLSALQTAPRELRSALPTLDLTIPNLFTHPTPQLRYAAAELYAHLLVVKPKAAFPSAFEQQLHFVTARMDDVHHVLERFTPAPATTRRVHSDVLPMCAVQMVRYYKILCRILCAMLRLSVRVAVPVAPLLHSLMGGLAHVEIDPYANVEECTLDADSALWVAVCVAKESMTALRIVTRALGSALLPYARIVARSVERRFARSLVRFRKEGGVAGYEERKLLYELTGAAVEVFGSVFMERVLNVFVELFEMEASFYAKCLDSAKKKVEKVSVLETGKKKRRRHGREVVEEHVDESEDERIASAVGIGIVREVEKIVDEGLGVCTVIFENRGMLTDKAVQALEQLELILTRLAEGEVEDHLLEAMRAAALGGGASRLRAEASPLLMQCAEKAKELVLEGVLGKRKRGALQTRSACEVVFHPRGPPILRSASDTITLQDADRATPIALQEGLVNTKNQIVPLNSEGNNSNSNTGLRHDTLSNASNGVLQKESKETNGVPGLEYHQDQIQQTGVSRGDDMNNKNNDVPNEADISIPPLPSETGAAERLTIAKTVLPSMNLTPGVDHTEQKSSHTENDSAPMQISPPLLSKSNVGGDQPQADKESNALAQHDCLKYDVAENEIVITSKHNEGEEHEQKITSEADEQALIASLRFEPSDEE